jgi:membrane fusion protein (multidrug efflux system)
MPTVEVNLELENEKLDAEARAPEPPKKNGRARPWFSAKARALFLGGAALLVVAGTVLYFHYRGVESTDDAQVDGHLVPIAPKISGNVLQVLVSDNQAVKTGQILVRLDPRDYQARVDQARAALALAQSQAQSAEIGVPWTRETTQSGTNAADAQLAAARAEESRARITLELANGADLGYARANVTKRQANYERASADLDRMKPLVAKAEISQQQFDSFVAAAKVAESEWKADQERLAQAEKNVESARAALAAAHAAVLQAEAAVSGAHANSRQVNMRTADAASASAGVVQAKANLEAAELQLSYATIVAPVDGVVTSKAVEAGQIVQPGQGMFVLVPLQSIWVTANFKETQLARVRPGQKAEVKVDMYGEKFSGHVDSIAGATGSRLSLLPPENATGNYVKVVQRIPVKIVLDPIPPEKAVLRPGMNVDATIHTR